MATGKENVKSSSDSEEISDNHCFPCSQDGNTMEGKKYCVDCGSYFCDQCLVYHAKFPALRLHTIVDKYTDAPRIAGGSSAIAVPTNRCLIHRGHIVDKFCKGHDEVCCEACVTIKHRSCDSVLHLKDAAKGVRSSEEFRDTKDSLNNTLIKIKTEKEKRNNNQSSLNQRKDVVLRDIDKDQEDYIKRIKELAEASRKQVISEHAELVNAAQSDNQALETVLSVLEESSKNDNDPDLNEAQIFTFVKNGKHAVKDVQTIVDELSFSWIEKDLAYCFDNELSDSISTPKSFGHFHNKTDNKPYLVTIYKKVNVKMENDRSTCWITSACLLNNGTLFISDYQNKNLKRLDKTYKVTDSISLDGHPIAVCITGHQELAVGLREEKKVQFLHHGDILSRGTSLSTDLKCTGICFDSKEDTLYVSCGAKWLGDTQAKVNVYKRDGTLLRTVEKDEAGIPLFSSSGNIAMATSASELYIAGRDCGLIAVGRSSRKLWTYTDPKLNDPWGICILPGNQLLVTGFSSGTIMQVGMDGREVCELIGKSEGLVWPYAVIYDRQQSRIIVGDQSTEIRVYNLSKK